MARCCGSASRCAASGRAGSCSPAPRLLLRPCALCWRMLALFTFSTARRRLLPVRGCHRRIRRRSSGRPARAGMCRRLQQRARCHRRGWRRARRARRSLRGDAQRGGQESRALRAVPISCGAWLGDYTGVVKLQQPRDTSRYLLELRVPSADGEPQLLLDIDAEHWGNEARFIAARQRPRRGAQRRIHSVFEKARPSVRTTQMLHRRQPMSHHGGEPFAALRVHTGELAIGVIAQRRSSARRKFSPSTRSTSRVLQLQ